MEFIEGPRQEGCFLCQAAQADPSRDAEHYVVARGPQSFAMMNRYPYNSGHLMVVPYSHVAGLDELTPEVANDLMALTQRALRALRVAFSPDGFNVGINLGRVAGAGAADHVHQHVVPRWAGDTNFMPVLADVKVLPEHMKRSYDKIRAAFDQSASGKATASGP